MVLHRFFSAFFYLALVFILSSCTFFQNDAVEEDLTAQDEEEYEEEDMKSGQSPSSALESSQDEEEGPDTVADEDEEMAEDLAELGEGFSDGEEEALVQDQTQEDDEEELSSADFVDSNSEGKETDYGDITDGDIEVPEQLASAPVKTWVPVKKIPQKPWKQGGRWINAVYIARDGDTMESLGRKIYGSRQNSASELKNFNPRFKNKEPKVGDKIYYNSPKRPQDGSQFLTYYEDNAEQALSFDLQAGDNIRSAAAKLLGHPDSWKEVWATNFNIESKGVVQETVSLMYWAGKKDLAMSESAPISSDSQEPSLEEPQPPAAEEALNQQQEQAPLPDSPLEDLNKGAKEEIQAENNNDILNMDSGGIEPSFEEPEALTESFSDGAVGGGTPPAEAATSSSVGFLQSSKFKGFVVIAVLALFGFWFVRLIRRRKERSEFDFSQTNIDIDNIEE